MFLRAFAVFFSLCCLFPSIARAEEPALWAPTKQAMSNVRALLDIDQQKNPSGYAKQLAIVKAQLAVIAVQKDELEQVRQHVYVSGLLQAKPFLDDLAAVEAKAKDPAVQQILREVGYAPMTDYFGRSDLLAPPPPPPGTRGLPKGGFEALESISFGPAAAAALGPAAPPRTDYKAIAASKLKEYLATAIAQTELLEKLDKSATRSGRLLLAMQTAALGTVVGLAYAAGIIPPDWIHNLQISPRNAVIAVGTAMGANNVLFRLWTQQFPDFYEKLQALMSRGKDVDVVKGYDAIVEASPVHGAELRELAAQEKLKSRATYYGILQNAALRSVEADKKTTAVTSLSNLALNSIRNGHTERAQRELKKVLERTAPGSQPYEQAKATLAALAIKDAMEDQLSKARGWRAVAKGVAGIVGLGLSYLGLPVPSSVWAAASTGVGSFIGPARIWNNILWAAPGEKAMEGIVGENSKKLQAAFAKIMEVDPSGRIVGVFAQYGKEGALEPFVYKPAIEELRKSHTLEAGQVLKETIDYLVASSSGDTQRVRFTAQAAAEQLDTCLVNVAKLVDPQKASVAMP